jgi:hypothetical protein
MEEKQMGYIKRALKREPGYPQGVSAPLYLECVCGEKISLPVIAGMPMTYCCGKCGRVYDKAGWVIQDIPQPA